jgi:hypothetical protein
MNLAMLKKESASWSELNILEENCLLKDLVGTWISEKRKYVVLD